MKYRFATQDESYADFASGLVLRSSPGKSAFPVRLSREMFEQGRALLPRSVAHRRCIVYDPCCGAGYLATCVGLLYGNAIASIAASDIDPAAVELARSNLTLLTGEGAQAREDGLHALFRAHANPAHAQAIESAHALRGRIVGQPPSVRCFVADARDEGAMRAQLGETPELVITDVPYGRMDRWVDGTGEVLEAETALQAMLTTLDAVVSAACVVALATESDLKVTHPAFERRRQLKIGKRRVTWLVHRGDGSLR